MRSQVPGPERGTRPGFSLESIFQDEIVNRVRSGRYWLAIESFTIKGINPANRF